MTGAESAKVAPRRPTRGDHPAQPGAWDVLDDHAVGDIEPIVMQRADAVQDKPIPA